MKDLEYYKNLIKEYYGDTFQGWSEEEFNRQFHEFNLNPTSRTLFKKGTLFHTSCLFVFASIACQYADGSISGDFLDDLQDTYIALQQSFAGKHKIIVNFNKFKSMLLKETNDMLKEKEHKLKKKNIDLNFDNVSFELLEQTENEINGNDLTQLLCQNKDIESILNMLTAKEKIILIKRYFDDFTQDEVGKLFNVSGAAISRTEITALRKLRHPERLIQLYDENNLADIPNATEGEIEFCKQCVNEAKRVVAINNIKKKASLKTK